MALVTEKIPLALYVHWPWCLHKCPYCDFNSHAKPRELIPEAEYLEALKGAFLRFLPFIDGREIETVFFGGGTPSLMRPETIDNFLSFVRANAQLSPKAEITLEANPGTTEYTDFSELRNSGVNRLSIGVQSFNDAKLKILGRIHTGQQARQAISKAAEVFDNFNLDLMFALPGQTKEALIEDLTTALQFHPTHLSYYQLTIEEGTAFYKHEPSGLPDMDLAYAMLEEIESTTAKLGLDHYEVSAYAKPGFRCRHNLNYWQFGDYVGVGPGAHGKITKDGKIFRTASVNSPALWMERISKGLPPYSEIREVQKDDLPFEFMLNALRLRQGVPSSFWEERTGLPLSYLAPVWNLPQAHDLLKPLNEKICTTDLGWKFLNEAQELFL